MEANNLNQVPNKVSFAKKIGYSIGGATDTLAYDFVAAFLLFFLTNFTGVKMCIRDRLRSSMNSTNLSGLAASSSISLGIW